MIKVNIKQNRVIITGHAGYDEYGKDIVCASVSSIVITSVNAALKLENNSLEYIDKIHKYAKKLNLEDEGITRKDIMLKMFFGEIQVDETIGRYF